MDVMDACILMTSTPVKDINQTRNDLANKMTERFVDIPGLRTKDFTTICKDGKWFMNSFYLFTNMKCLKEYFDSPLWKMLKEKMPDMTHRPVQAMQGTEATMELGMWPQCPVWKKVRPTK